LHGEFVVEDGTFRSYCVDGVDLDSKLEVISDDVDNVKPEFSRLSDFDSIKYVGNEIFDFVLDDYVDKYKDFCSYDEFICLKRTNVLTDDVRFVFIKVPKRGNDVGRNRRIDRLKPILDFCSSNADVDFYKSKARSYDSNKFMITLTANPNVSFDGWNRSINEMFNVFITKLRKRFGRIKLIRVDECFLNGKLHIHCVLLFLDSKLRVERAFVKCKGGKRRLAYLLPRGSNNRFYIENCWDAFVVMESILSYKGVFYALKYLIKDYKNLDSVEEKKLYQSFLMCSVFNKRSYSVSKGFLKNLQYDYDGVEEPLLDSIYHNSNCYILFDLFFYEFEGVKRFDKRLKSNYFFVKSDFDDILVKNPDFPNDDSGFYKFDVVCDKVVVSSELS